MQTLKKLFPIILATILGFLFPAPGLLLKPYLSYFLMGLMTLSFFKINLSDLKEEKEYIKKHLLILFFIFITPVFFAFLFKSFLPQELFIGLVLICATPTAVSSVVFTDMLEGQSQKAAVSVALSHFLAPFITSFVVLVALGSSITIDFISMLVLIFKMIFIPFLISRIFFRYKDSIINISKYINSILFITLVWGVVAPINGLLKGNEQSILILALAISFVLFTQGFVSKFITKDKCEQISWMTISMFKNFTLASIIAFEMFGPLVVLGPIVYSIMCHLSVIFLSIHRKAC